MNEPSHQKQVAFQGLLGPGLPAALPPIPHRNITLLISGPVVAFVAIQSLS